MSIITILLYQHTLTILKYFGILIFDVEAIVLPGKLCRTESLFLRHGPFLICLGGLVFFGCPIKTCRVCPLTAGLQRHGYAFPRTAEVGFGSSLWLWLASAPIARPPAGEYLRPWAGRACKLGRPKALDGCLYMPIHQPFVPHAGLFRQGAQLLSRRGCPCHLSWRSVCGKSL